MKFKPEDFVGGDSEIKTWFATEANRILQAHLATLPRVYGYTFGKCKDIDWRMTDYSNVSNEMEHIVQKKSVFSWLHRTSLGHCSAREEGM